MTPSRRCSVCGSPIARREGTLCSRCDGAAGSAAPTLFEIGGSSAASPAARTEFVAPPSAGGAPTSRPAQTVDPRYRIEAELGRGGMGVVWLAHDERLGRPVAIKVLGGSTGGSQGVSRFLLEARIQGRLEHPNICPVHDLGVDSRGLPYLAMKRVEGTSLDVLLDRLRAGDAEESSFPLTRRLEIFVKVCDAVAFAHASGVLHRDLKPSNVMVGTFGEVLVMDWGLARDRQRADEPISWGGGTSSSDSRLTVDGAVLGTPAYMPPEQAEGELDRVDERSDVYSLGAILYELLTLAPPVEGPDARAVLDRVRLGRIVPPAERAPERRIPADLSAVTLKALARQPERRYPTVQALQGEVTAFLEGRALSAAHYTPWRLFAMWLARNRIFSATAGVAALLLAATGVFYAVRIERERARAEREAELAREAEAEATRQRRLADLRREEAESEAHRARLAEHEARRQVLHAKISAARAAILSGEISSAHEINGEALDLFPEVGLAPLPALILDQVVSRAGPTPVQRFRAHEAAVTSICLDSEGRRAITGAADGTLVLWNVAEGRPIERLRASGDRVTGCAFSAGDRWIAVADAGGQVELLGAGDLRSAGRWTGGGPWTDLAFSPDAECLAAVDDAGALRTWRVADGLEPGLGPIVHLTEDGTRRDRLAAVLFDPDGDRILTSGWTGSLYLWDRRTGDAVGRLSPEGVGRCHRLAFLPGGDRVAAGLDDGRILVRDLASGTAVLRRAATGNPVGGLWILPSGDWLAAVDAEGWLSLREVEPRLEREVVSTGGLRLGRDTSASAFSPRAGWLLLGTRGGELVLHALDPYRVASGRASTNRSPEPGLISLDLSSDGRFLAMSRMDRKARIFDLESGKGLLDLDWTGPGSFSAVALAPDSRSVALAAGMGRILVLDLATRQVVREVQGAAVPTTRMIHAPGGRRLLTGDLAGGLTLWDLESGRSILSIEGHSGSITALAFAGEDAMVSGGADGALRAWDPSSGQLLFESELARPWPSALEFDPERGRLLAGGDAKVWSWSVAGTRFEPAAEPLEVGRGMVVSLSIDRSGDFLLASTPTEFGAWEIDASIRWIRVDDYDPLGDTPWESASIAMPVGERRVRIPIWTCRPGGFLAGPLSLDDAFWVPTFALDGGCDRAAFGPRTGGAPLVLDFQALARRRGLPGRLESARRRLAEDPHDPEALRTFGEWYALRGQPAWAVEFYERSREHGGEVDPAALGLACWQAGRLREAVDEFVRAREATADEDERILLGLRIAAIRDELAGK